jgi:N-acetylglucosamine-6-phosphate deacetylase
VQNATIWTEGKQGKLENGEMLIVNGRISKIGTGLSVPPNAFVIDASGKDVTPGIIDAHSHTGISGSVNEGSHAITAEVRIADVIDPDDIWIYRQLAGGTTMANVLHGSANPIGGQNAIVKWRWGMPADDMVMEGAPQGIKFALGENVKQSNFTFGGRPSTRYPQTREGVEQIIKDEFKAALDYEREFKEWEKDKTRIPPRRDLQLDAVLEIINGKRQIHSHAYRSDEMMMLIQLMDQFHVKIAAFHHALEGYKIADEMAKRGIAGSSFSDWWAYKMEAWDAIPGNGPLMHDQGVVVTYNSDSDDLARRLNWEAAKAVKYGIPEEEALKFVTLNSAITLGIDKRVGSLEPGKDADFVIWSGDPLLPYSKCEQTWIDGRKYFDIREDREMQSEIQKERAALIQKILSAKKEPAAGAGVPFRMRRPNASLLNFSSEGQNQLGGSHEN